MGDTQFRRALFGYNRADVERFLAETTDERERLNNALERVEVLMAELQDGPKAILEAAHREAAAIKANAEREAARILLPPAPVPPPAPLPSVITVPVTSPAASVAAVPVLPPVPALSAQPVMPVPPVELEEEEQTEEDDEQARSQSASFLQPFVAEELLASSVRQEPKWDVEFLHPTPPSQWRRWRVAALAVGCAALLGFLSVHFRNQFATVPAKVQSSSLAAPVTTPRTANIEPVAALDASAPKSMTLTISAEKACWIRMTIDDTQPVERVLQPSETLVLHALDKASLRVGDAGAIKLLINSRPARPLGNNGEVVNRLITMENYASFLTQESS